MAVEDSIKPVCEFKDSMRKSLEWLANQKKELEEAEREFINKEILKIEQSFEISANDNEDYKKCKTNLCKYNKCISPCKSCGYSMCSQCTYGYMGLVSKIRLKYTLEELEEYKENCPYALIAYIEKY